MSTHPYRSLADAVESSANQRQERLESELHGHKTNLIKESIRQSHNALGDFYYSRGNLQVCQHTLHATRARVCMLGWGRVAGWGGSQGSWYNASSNSRCDTRLLDQCCSSTG